MRKPITYGHKRRRLTIDLTEPEDMTWAPTSQASLQPSPLIAKQPPSSQKAATIMVEPDAGSIDQLVSICGLDAATAARFLRVKQNDVNAAMNAVFDGETIEKLEAGSTWDESVWQTDRDGNNLHQLGISVPNTGRNSPAPSLGMTNPKTKADEERELKAALAASRESPSSAFQQESGILQNDGTEVKFGPATREQYDANQWALVPTYSAAQEIVPDVPAKERVQHGHEPRLLKHLPDGDYTPNLLTICCAIPKAREAFLMREHIKSDYGHDAEWWKGHPVPMPRIVHTADGSAVERNSDKYAELIAEMQRLMAFLDRSDRAYATIGGITSATVIKDNNLQTTKSGTLLELFLQSWILAAASKVGHDQVASDQVTSLFNTIVGTNSKDGMETADLTVFDLCVKAEEGDKKDLFELLDNLLWDTDPDDLEQSDNFIEQPADMMVMKVTRFTSPLGLEVPAAFHLDKYLERNVATTRGVRREMTEGKRRIKQIEKIEKKLQFWQHPSKSTQIDARKVLGYTLDHYSGKTHKAADSADRSNHASLVNHEPPHYSDVVLQLESVIDSIDAKLNILAEEKEKTRKAVSDLSKADPPGLPEPEQKHRYTLRGVATKPSITYVLQRKSAEDSQDMIFQHDDDTTPEGYQWWRLEYEASSTSTKLHRTKIGDYDVLRAVELEHSSALLVYASDEATDFEAYWDEELPEPLQTFIQRDNNDFANELSREQSDPPPYGGSWADSLEQIPRKSIERHDSMDSTTAVDLNDRDSPTSNGSPVDFHDPAQHHAYGLGYGSKLDPDPVDIHLDPEVNLLGDTGDPDNEIEMVEKQHAPLIPRPVRDSASRADAAMEGTESQDMGVGGASHIEDKKGIR